MFPLSSHMGSKAPKGKKSLRRQGSMQDKLLARKSRKSCIHRVVH